MPGCPKALRALGQPRAAQSSSGYSRAQSDFPDEIVRMLLNVAGVINEVG